jgi:enoyl-CoA hydratase/carnithine racemase
MEADLASALEYETYAQTHCWKTEDAKEGVRAFVEKRPAVFQGK